MTEHRPARSGPACGSEVLLCAEGGPSRGYGHIARILALAGNLGCPDSLLLLSPAGERAALKGLRLAGDVAYGTSANAAEAVADRVRDRAPGLIVLDGLCFDEAFFARLVKAELAGTIVLLESLPVRSDRIGIRIRPFLHASPRSDGPGFAGGAYWMLRREFDPLLRKTRPVPERHPRVLLTMGGTDHLRLTERLAEPAAQALPGSRLDIVCGPVFVGDLDRLRGIAARHANIHLHLAPANLAELMHAADIAVTAGGFTTYEVAALGVPSLVIATTAHEDRNAQAVAAAGCARIVAFHSEIGSRALAGRLARQLARLADDDEGRKAMALAGRRAIDGRGRERVQRVILDALREHDGTVPGTTKEETVDG